jgi:hypothetical protein
MAGRGRYLIVLGGAAAALAMAVAVLGGAAATGRAATPQQVTASLTCQPGTVNPNANGTTGCVLTVTNIGGNSVNSVVVTDNASAGTFLNSSSSLCAASGNTLSCSIGKLTGAGTPGSTFSETHELDVPSSGTVTQDVTGRDAPNPNSRGSDTVRPATATTNLDSSSDFDGKFANQATDSVQTGGAISGTNPYSTGATLGTTGFAFGLAVREQSAGTANPNCPSTGCFAGQVIQFDITPLPGSSFPSSFRLTIKVYVGPGVKENELDIRHTSTLHGTNLVPMCADGSDPSGDCVVSKPIGSSTKIATITIEGPGTGNGGWGVG